MMGVQPVPNHIDTFWMWNPLREHASDNRRFLSLFVGVVGVTDHDVPLRGALTETSS